MIRVTAVTCLSTQSRLFCYLSNSIIKEGKGGVGGVQIMGKSFLLHSSIFLCPVCLFCSRIEPNNLVLQKTIQRVWLGNGVNSFCLHKVLQVQFCVTDELVPWELPLEWCTTTESQAHLWPSCCWHKKLLHKLLPGINACALCWHITRRSNTRLRL